MSVSMMNISGTINYPCIVCGKAVHSDSRAVECERCLEWCHVGCGMSISNTTYANAVQVPHPFKIAIMVEHALFKIRCLIVGSSHVVVQQFPGLRADFLLSVLPRLCLNDFDVIFCIVGSNDILTKGGRLAMESRAAIQRKMRQIHGLLSGDNRRVVMSAILPRAFSYTSLYDRSSASLFNRIARLINAGLGDNLTRTPSLWHRRTAKASALRQVRICTREYYVALDSLKDAKYVCPTFDEALNACISPNGFSSAYTIQALATVIGIPIRAIYPRMPGTWKYVVDELNQVYLPRGHQEREKEVVIMWTRMGAPAPGNIWTANHFVPIVPDVTRSLPSQLATSTPMRKRFQNSFINMNFSSTGSTMDTASEIGHTAVADEDVDDGHGSLTEDRQSPVFGSSTIKKAPEIGRTGVADELADDGQNSPTDNRLSPVFGSSTIDKAPETGRTAVADELADDGQNSPTEDRLSPVFGSLFSTSGEEKRTAPVPEHFDDNHMRMPEELCDIVTISSDESSDEGLIVKDNAVKVEVYVNENLHPLPDSKFLDMDDVINMLKDDNLVAVDRIPRGDKSNVYAVVDFKNNRDRKNRERMNNFSDDCGAWSKTPSPKSAYLISGLTRKVLAVKGGLYGKYVKIERGNLSHCIPNQSRKAF
ncbi:hypothetical protein CAPTEDRAFT_197412 [Capitella teleta]|uniref:Uncharacterized protein n=1 Tax=Capitella teleta TaxID=283909 RepID=R7TJZ6_CAPTE|nr:hypothetical protein CAPTEDRAFT_197412 [Capitella teleta]|eukprot:ELT91846.1 hypothetical protein CAPTEDRAFT_197412 [Capitella teleta]